VHYSDIGEGNVVLLIHGYLESLDVFTSLSKSMSKYCRCICIDIPGHGLSTVVDDLSMPLVSGLIKSLMDSLLISKFSVIGHSLGGYIALSYAELYPESLNSICLLHSSANADSPEKQKNRLREIDLVNKGMKNLICASSIPSMFSNSNKQLFKEKINSIIEKAKLTPEKGVLAALNCMRNRKDENLMLKKLKIPKYLFLGKYDSFIDFDKAYLDAYYLECKVFVFDHSGHASFIEERQKCLDLLVSLYV